MNKYKNALEQTTLKLAQGTAVWYLSLAINSSENVAELFVLGFAFLWLATDVLIWLNRFVLLPSAKAIYAANK